MCRDARTFQRFRNAEMQELSNESEKHNSFGWYSRLVLKDVIRRDISAELFRKRIKRRKVVVFAVTSTFSVKVQFGFWTEPSRSYQPSSHKFSQCLIYAGERSKPAKGLLYRWSTSSSQKNYRRVRWSVESGEKCCRRIQHWLLRPIENYGRLRIGNFTHSRTKFTRSGTTERK